MKKTYETPSIEVVKFQYRDQVVVASGGAQCHVNYFDNQGPSQNCTTDGVFHNNERPY